MTNPQRTARNELVQYVDRLQPCRISGHVERCQGGLAVCTGISALVGLGEACWIEQSQYNSYGCDGDRREPLLAEVVAIDQDGAHLLPFDRLDGIGIGARVIIAPDQNRIRPSEAWLGRVIDAFGRPLDGGQPLPQGPEPYWLQAPPVEAHRRRDLGPRLDLGVRALNLFTPCREGQRMGIFAGSGVGKSTLLAMLARHSDADALVLGLIGERGRELAGFLQQGLGPAGRARSVVVVATSDLPAMVRRRAAYVALTVAEALRDRGLRVLCLFDSLTRFATALREIHLAAGEPPTSRGYPPSVFAELPRLLERAGPGPGAGSITGLFTVLVEGDPLADAVRAILDGHIVLDRRTAEAGRYPAIDVLRSLSRVAPECYGADERPLVERARQLIRAHADTAELIQLGAYRQGSDPLIDEAIRVRPALEALLAQGAGERSTIGEAIVRLAAALGADQPAGAG
jgi:flagellum-specific ATP synthase